MLSLFRPADQIVAALILGSFTLSAAIVNAIISMRVQRARTTTRKTKATSSPAAGKKTLIPRKVLAIGLGLTCALVVIGLREERRALQLASAAASPLHSRLSAPSEAQVPDATDTRADAAAPAGHDHDTATLAEPLEYAGTASFAVDPSGAAWRDAGGLAQRDGHLGPGAIGGSDGGPVRAPPYGLDTAGTHDDPAAPSETMDSLLRATGMTVLYRYGTLLSRACDEDEQVLVTGNWPSPEVDLAFACLQDGWLAVDLAPLLEERLIVANVTYCMDFRMASGQRGRSDLVLAHGVPSIPAAPGTGAGTDADSVDAEPEPERYIGLRIVRNGGSPRVAFTDAEPRVPCPGI